MSVYDTALAVIPFLGRDDTRTLGTLDLPVKQQVMGGIDLTTNLINPAASTVAGWYKFVSPEIASSLSGPFYFGKLGVSFTAADAGMWSYFGGTYATGITSIVWRLRNTETTTFSITPLGLLFDEWNHFCFTSDSVNTRLYVNGVFEAQLAHANIEYRGVTADGLRRNNGAIYANTGLWESILSDTDIAWLADPANRTEPPVEGGGGGSVAPSFSSPYKAGQA